MKNNNQCGKKHLSKKKSKFIKAVIVIGIIILFVEAIVILTLKNSGKSIDKDDELVNKIENPEEYTWEEYQELTPEEKMLFPDGFENMEAYNEWFENVQQEDTNLPTIDLGDKNVEEYTWEEYQKLTVEQKAVFPDYFESFEEYQEWYDKVCK